MKKTDSAITVRDYYEHLGSRLGYRIVLWGSQHFGYYPNSTVRMSEWTAQHVHHDILAKHLNLKPGMTILDAGCGQGFIACDLAERYGCTVTGIDLTPYIVERANARAARQKVRDRTTFCTMDYHHIDFPDASFDAVYAVETLCHATDLPQVLREFFRVLKPGGKLVCFEYTIAAQEKFNEDDEQTYRTVLRKTASPGLDEFREQHFVTLLESAGFLNRTMENISEHAERSFRRLRRIALIPYWIFRLLGRHRNHPNLTIAVEYYNLAKKRLLGYCIYTAMKPY